jgi:hypothetical protein
MLYTRLRELLTMSAHPRRICRCSRPHSGGRDIAVLLDMWVIFSVTGGGIVALVDLLEEEP